MKLEDVEQQIDEWCNSKECDEYFEYINRKFDIKEKRYKKFEKYLKKVSFKKLMKRLISEHNLAYDEKCILKGRDPYPNNKLYFVFDYVFDNSESVYANGSHSFFPNDMKKFKGFYFQIMYGQGSIHRVFNKNKEMLLSL